MRRGWRPTGDQRGNRRTSTRRASERARASSRGATDRPGNRDRRSARSTSGAARGGSVARSSARSKRDHEVGVVGQVESVVRRDRRLERARGLVAAPGREQRATASSTRRRRVGGIHTGCRRVDLERGGEVFEGGSRLAERGERACELDARAGDERMLAPSAAVSAVTEASPCVRADTRSPRSRAIVPASTSQIACMGCAPGNCLFHNARARARSCVAPSRSPSVVFIEARL